MMQLRKGLMIFGQIEQTTYQQQSQKIRQRVVIRAQTSQGRWTRERHFQKGMMIGFAVKSYHGVPDNKANKGSYHSEW